MRRLAILCCCATLATLVALGSQASAQLVPPECQSVTATIVGTEGSDRIVGTSGPDVIHALGGNDVILGLAGEDIICGGAGRDRIIGGAGDDILFGEAGRDTLRGGRGGDVLLGGDSHDRLTGGPGSDFIDGGNGRDVAKGGKGDDILDGGRADDRCIGDSGLDSAGRCEVNRTEYAAFRLTVGGALVHGVASAPTLDGATAITKSGFLEELGETTTLCLRFAATDADNICDGPEVLGLMIDEAWPFTFRDDEARYALRNVTTSWPPVDGQVELVRERPLSADVLLVTDSIRLRADLDATVPECQDVGPRPTVAESTYLDWGADNPDRFGGTVFTRAGNRWMTVLQVKMSEADAEALRGEFRNETGRVPCIETVNFTKDEIDAVHQAVRPLVGAVDTTLVRTHVNVTLPTPDGALIESLVAAAGDRPDLLSIDIENAYAVEG